MRHWLRYSMKECAGSGLQRNRTPTVGVGFVPSAARLDCLPTRSHEVWQNWRLGKKTPMLHWRGDCEPKEVVGRDSLLSTRI